MRRVGCAVVGSEGLSAWCGWGGKQEKVGKTFFLSSITRRFRRTFQEHAARIINHEICSGVYLSIVLSARDLRFISVVVLARRMGSICDVWGVRLSGMKGCPRGWVRSMQAGEGGELFTVHRTTVPRTSTNHQLAV